MAHTRGRKLASQTALHVEAYISLVKFKTDTAHISEDLNYLKFFDLSVEFAIP